MPLLDRDSFIALLQQLGDSNDGKALAAARDIHRRMTAAGLDWDDVLMPTDGDQGQRQPEPEAPLDQPAPAANEDTALIGRLLSRSGLSEDLRKEIEELRADIASGAFTARDRKYLQALESRLSRQS